jgi:hypothetical protein
LERPPAVVATGDDWPDSFFTSLSDSPSLAIWSSYSCGEALAMVKFFRQWDNVQKARRGERAMRLGFSRLIEQESSVMRALHQGLRLNRLRHPPGEELHNVTDCARGEERWKWKCRVAAVLARLFARSLKGRSRPQDQPSGCQETRWRNNRVAECWVIICDRQAPPESI